MRILKRLDKQLKIDIMIKKESIKQYKRQKHLENLAAKVTYEKAKYQENTEVKPLYENRRYLSNSENKIKC